jgi:hypothetical protein
MGLQFTLQSLDPSGAEPITVLSHLRRPQPGGQGFISPRNRKAQLYLWALGSLFITSYDLQGYWWRYSNMSPRGPLVKFKVKVTL